MRVFKQPNQEIVTPSDRYQWSADDLPATREDAVRLREAAKADGYVLYLGMPCAACGSPVRYSKTDKCADCHAVHMARKRGVPAYTKNSGSRLATASLLKSMDGNNSLMAMCLRRKWGNGAVNQPNR
jgi:hypothetical protein